MARYSKIEEETENLSNCGSSEIVPILYGYVVSLEGLEEDVHN
jgi:hypothetical protein